jgi:hypothetical protein
MEWDDMRRSRQLGFRSQVCWRLWTLLIGVLALTATAAADTLEVPGQFSTIQAALTAASDGDTVLVAPGTYLENDLTFDGKEIYLTSSDGADQTVIDGGGARPVFYLVDCEGAGAVVDGFTIENGHGVATFEGGGFTILGSSCPPGSTTMPTIRNNIIRDNTTDGSGAAIKIGSDADVLVEDNTISNNHSANYGGGLQIGPGSATIRRNTITGNAAALDGGGIKITADAVVMIEDNVIADNTADEKGGGVAVFAADVTILDNEVTGNTTVRLGAGLMLEGDVGHPTKTFEVRRNLIEDNTVTGSESTRGRGGAIHTFMDDTGSTLLIVDNTIVGNYCENTGCSGWNGSQCCHGGALDIKAGTAEATIRGNRITGNVGDLYGAGLLNNQSVLVKENLIADNRANYRYPALSCEGSTASSSTCQIESNIIAGNLVLNNDPALKDAALRFSEQADGDIVNNYFIGNTGARGGAIVVTNQTLSVPTIASNTFVDNLATNTGGGTVFTDNEVVIANNIFHGDIRAFRQNSGASFTLQENNFREQTTSLALIGSEMDSVAELNGLAGASGNTDHDEGFVNPAGTTAAELHLASGSDLIDAASCTDAPALDFDAQARPQGGACDVGADEVGDGAGAELNGSPTSIDFGELVIPSSRTEEVLLANGDDAIVTVHAVAVTDTTNFSFDVNGGSDPCEEAAPVLLAGRSCTVSVTFAPASEGVFNADLIVTSNAPDVTVALSGSRTDSPCNPDINDDSQITNADLELLARCYFENAVDCVDVNCDGNTDAGDLVAEIDYIDQYQARSRP